MHDCREWKKKMFSQFQTQSSLVLVWLLSTFVWHGWWVGFRETVGSGMWVGQTY